MLTTKTSATAEFTDNFLSVSGSDVVVFRLLLLPPGPLHHSLPNRHPQRQQRLELGPKAAEHRRRFVQSEAAAAPGGGEAAELHAVSVSCGLWHLRSARAHLQHHPGLHAHHRVRGHGSHAGAAASLPVVLQDVGDTGAAAVSVQGECKRRPQMFFLLSFVLFGSFVHSMFWSCSVLEISAELNHNWFVPRKTTLLSLHMSDLLICAKSAGKNVFNVQRIDVLLVNSQREYIHLRKNVRMLIKM